MSSVFKRYSQYPRYRENGIIRHFVLVGGHSDCDPGERTVSHAEGVSKALEIEDGFSALLPRVDNPAATKVQVDFIEASALSGLNVHAAFQFFAIQAAGYMEAVRTHLA